MPFRTLGDLRSELLARLGMGGMGASGGANLTLVNGLLKSAQKQLYWLQDWKHLTDYQDKTTGIGQNLYDFPNAGVMGTGGCALHQRVLRVETFVGGEYVRIHEGITTPMWSTMETRGQPRRFDRFAQIMTYPKADAAYTLRVWFIADAAAFSADADRCSIDDEMVLLHATAYGKAHYRQPDAKLYSDQLEVLLARIRAQAFSSDGVVQRRSNAVNEPKPAVLGRDV